jgi:hypothetical protein
MRRLDERIMENSGERPDAASLTERQPAVKLTTIVAAGLAGGLAAFFTSRFGITGTVLGTARERALRSWGAAARRPSFLSPNRAASSNTSKPRPAVGKRVRAPRTLLKGDPAAPS